MSHIHTHENYGPRPLQLQEDLSETFLKKPKKILIKLKVGLTIIQMERQYHRIPPK